jgi:hypothetical protein
VSASGHCNLQRKREFGHTKFFRSALLHAMEILTRLFQSIQSVDRRARFKQGFRLHETETSRRARDKHDTVGQVEFGQAFRRSQIRGGFVAILESRGFFSRWRWRTASGYWRGSFPWIVDVVFQPAWQERCGTCEEVR